MVFGEKLQALRKEQGITQESLAEQLGVSRQAVSKWKSGAAWPETEKILTLCRMFGLSADELLLNVERPVETPTEEPAEALVETPADTPAEIPAEASDEAPTEAPAEALDEPPAENLTEAPAAHSRWRWLSILLSAALLLSLTVCWLSINKQTEQRAEIDRLLAEQTALTAEQTALTADVKFLQLDVATLERGAAAASNYEKELLRQIELLEAGLVRLPLTDTPEAAREMARFFLRFGREWRLDHLPAFDLGAAPTESGDYLMWAFVVNLDGWGNSTGVMSKEYVANTVLQHFGLTDLSHTALFDIWEFDGNRYIRNTALPRGIKDEQIYLFRTFTVKDTSGDAVYTVELLRVEPAWTYWGNAAMEEIFEALDSEPFIGDDSSQFTPVAQERISFKMGFNGPVFVEHTIEPIGQ